jgi:DNA-binding response OmpR family regulator
MERAASRRKVLFVEDEPSIRSTYERFFSSSYEMAFAGSGTEALRRLQTFEPDVLVLDMRLPDTDGVALLQEIRVSHPSLPVVVTTAYVSMEPLMNVLDLGHSGYLVKPFNMDDLAARIDAAG